MARKHIKVSRRMLFTWFGLSGLILLFAPQDLTGKFQLGFVRIFRWPLSMGGDLALTANTQQQFQDVVPRRDYDKLLNHIDNLQETLRQQREKFEKIHGLYNTYVWEGTNYVVADVITPNIDSSSNELTIHYLRNPGLAKGQFVLGENSIIGTISDVSSRTARVKLFTDPTSGIHVKIGDLNVPRMMQGNGDNSAKIPLLRTEHKIKTGDKVRAQKCEFLGAPVIIGRVAEIKEDHENPLLWDITVKPACDIEKLEDVAVIIMGTKE
jgi:cell shape-determining protein MreC